MKIHGTTIGFTASETLQARAAFRITSLLDDGIRQLPHPVTERLRFAREKALERARAVTLAPSVAVVGFNAASATLTVGGRATDRGPRRWWLGIASVLPLAVLLGGLVLIQRFHVSSQVSMAAEVDAALLTDELPPTAYSDPGFVEFLKTTRN